MHASSSAAPGLSRNVFGGQLWHSAVPLVAPWTRAENVSPRGVVQSPLPNQALAVRAVQLRLRPPPQQAHPVRLTQRRLRAVNARWLLYPNLQVVIIVAFTRVPATLSCEPASRGLRLARKTCRQLRRSVLDPVRVCRTRGALLRPHECLVVPGLAGRARPANLAPALLSLQTWLAPLRRCIEHVTLPRVHRVARRAPCQHIEARARNPRRVLDHRLHHFRPIALEPWGTCLALVHLIKDVLVGFTRSPHTVLSHCPLSTPPPAPVRLGNCAALAPPASLSLEASKAQLPRTGPHVGTSRTPRVIANARVPAALASVPACRGLCRALQACGKIRRSRLRPVGVGRACLARSRSCECLEKAWQAQLTVLAHTCCALSTWWTECTFLKGWRERSVGGCVEHPIPSGTGHETVHAKIIVRFPH
eukprot:1736832-Rhodomonas_salina.2